MKRKLDENREREKKKKSAFCKTGKRSNIVPHIELTQFASS